jgi:hypothetical protein
MPAVSIGLVEVHPSLFASSMSGDHVLHHFGKEVSRQFELFEAQPGVLPLQS